MILFLHEWDLKFCGQMTSNGLRMWLNCLFENTQFVSMNSNFKGTRNGHQGIIESPYLKKILWCLQYAVRQHYWWMIHKIIFFPSTLINSYDYVVCSFIYFLMWHFELHEVNLLWEWLHFLWLNFLKQNLLPYSK
jgi:hypothetical protein